MLVGVENRPSRKENMTILTVKDGLFMCCSTTEVAKENSFDQKIKS